METVVIRRNDWTQLIDNVTKKAGKEMPVWQCICNYYSVCMPSLVTPLSIQLWNLYQRLNHYHNERFATFLALPSIVEDSIYIIELETDRIDKAKMKAEEKRSKHNIRQGRNR